MGRKDDVTAREQPGELFVRESAGVCVRAPRRPPSPRAGHACRPRRWCDLGQERSAASPPLAVPLAAPSPGRARSTAHAPLRPSPPRPAPCVTEGATILSVDLRQQIGREKQRAFPVWTL
eukprot:5891247-Prymnesium_polylepis.2